MVNDSLFLKPDRIVAPTSWVGHIPFAFWIIEAVKPKIFVELGTHSGNSYFAFCQSVQRNRLPTQCYAVDTWEGDEHGGFYDDSIFGAVAGYNENQYYTFSQLLHMTFDDALSHFSDRTIDLLHIDGLHTYEAVKHDFECWLPKLSHRGVVLFHDINVKERNFGVWKFWEEITTQYPHLAFDHSFGLGVLLVGSVQTSALIDLINEFQSPSGKHRIKSLFARLGKMADTEHCFALTITEHDEQIRAIRGEHDEQIRAIRGEHDEQIRAIRGEHDEQIRTINTLQNEKINELENRLQKMVNSSSWRMTKPIRKITKSIRKRSRKIRNFFNPKIIEQFDEGKDLTFDFHVGVLRTTGDIMQGIHLLSFPVHENPIVSIIIPVYEQIAVTIRCLESIARYFPHTSFEIIIVDDYSSDDTASILGQIKGLYLFSNPENIGFIRSCNFAASKAKGKYLYFLNNDVEVTHDWLDALVSTFQNFSNVGLVGSKLVYPDGKLQEAGGIVWRDGSAWNFGRGQNPILPIYNYVRETDYCSGASIMIPLELFNEIGGFDMRYVPAYCEDSDFCFEVRKRGHRVYYQPASTIVHYEGVSNGTDVKSGVKAYQVSNTKKFFEKWNIVLTKENLNAGEHLFWARDRSIDKKTVLVIDHYVPTFDKDAGSKTMYQYIKLFCMLGYNIKFIGDNFQKIEPYTTIMQQMGVEVLYGSYFHHNWIDWLKANGAYIDFVLLSRPHIFEKYINPVRSYTKAKVIYYGHDLHFLRIKREYGLTKKKNLLKKSKKWENIEMNIMKKTDVSLYPSQREIDTIREKKINCDIRVLPPYMYDEKKYPYNPKERKNLFFIGGFNHTPNVDAMTWFCNKIFPKIRFKNPDIQLLVAGSHPSQKIFDLASESVIIKGFVTEEELGDLYESVRLTVAPLRYGAGIKGKIIESLYRGVPVITTSCGAEGITDAQGALAVVDEAEDMVSTILTLYDDYEQLKGMSEKGKQLVGKNFSFDSAINMLNQLFVK